MIRIQRLLPFLILCLPSALEAQLRLPAPVGYVNDFADVIPPDTERRIERISREVQSKSGGEIVVVTLRSLEGRTRDEVALQIGREWGIGRRGEPGDPARNTGRSEEHTSELQSRENLVCRLLLEKKNNTET